LGTQVAVGIVFNYAGKLYNRMLEAAREGNFSAAAKEQFRSQQFISCLLKHGRPKTRFLDTFQTSVTDSFAKNFCSVAPAI